MELEERVLALEHQVKVLESEIQKTLVAIRDNLPEKHSRPSRWQKNAWVLALVNMLLAVVLFTNIYLYIPGLMPFSLDATLANWLRALWLALAFVWLILQLYPLALLLEEEDRQWQGVVWRNARAFVKARPSFLVMLTLVVLIITIINTTLPVLWLLVSVALLVAVASIAVRNMLDLRRDRGAAGRS